MIGWLLVGILLFMVGLGVLTCAIFAICETDTPLAALFFVLLLPVLTLTVMSFRNFNRSLDRETCLSWAESTDREVKFADLHYFSWTCLTPSTDGRWIDVAALRNVEADR